MVLYIIFKIFLYYIYYRIPKVEYTKKKQEMEQKKNCQALIKIRKQTRFFFYSQ